MQPPKPALPPEPPPVVAVAPVEVKLFAGSLIGVIRDSDPKYCYAVLKWQDNRIQLVATGGHLTNGDASLLLFTASLLMLLVACAGYPRFRHRAKNYNTSFGRDIKRQMGRRIDAHSSD